MQMTGQLKSARELFHSHVSTTLVCNNVSGVQMKTAVKNSPNSLFRTFEKNRFEKSTGYEIAKESRTLLACKNLTVADYEILFTPFDRAQISLSKNVIIPRRQKNEVSTDFSL